MPNTWLSEFPVVLNPAESNLLYVGHYDAALVALSIGIAILSSYALLLIARLVAQRHDSHFQRRKYFSEIDRIKSRPLSDRQPGRPPLPRKLPP